MTEAEIFQVVRGASAETASLYGQVISINFAMVVAIFYFLSRSGLVIKALAFCIYLVGMLMYVGLMLEESNVKYVALRALAAIPADVASPVSRALVDLQRSWLFSATAVFLNAGIWMMIAAIVYLLFFWRKPADRP